MRSVTLQAPGKLNLHLGIYSEFDDRHYHRADSLMVAVDLADKIVVEELSALGEAPNACCEPQIVCVPAIDVPPQKNTAYRAAVALAKRVGRSPSVRITLSKQVPDQAGMGGSSSDAAAVLLALCRLWDVDSTSDIVMQAAQSVGADVPFFLDPVPTLLGGAGDVVSCKFPPLDGRVPVVLVRPAGPGVSTPVAYAEFDRAPTEPASPDALCRVLDSGEAAPKDIAAHLFNNLDSVACRLLPKVLDVRTWLLAQSGVLGGQVTGSGSCVFGVCDTHERAESIAQAAREELHAWAQASRLM